MNARRRSSGFRRWTSPVATLVLAAALVTIVALGGAAAAKKPRPAPANGNAPTKLWNLYPLETGGRLAPSNPKPAKHAPAPTRRHVPTPATTKGFPTVWVALIVALCLLVLVLGVRVVQLSHGVPADRDRYEPRFRHSLAGLRRWFTTVLPHPASRSAVAVARPRPAPEPEVSTPAEDSPLARERPDVKERTAAALGRAIHRPEQRQARSSSLNPPVPQRPAPKLQRQPPAPLEPSPPAPPAPTRTAPRVESCEIVVWRGYVKSAFRAVAGGSQGARTIAESPMFRARGPTVEETPGAVAAHALLVDRLVAEGWKPRERGPEWFSRNFTRQPEPPAP
jgi:hypothetical protein